MRRRSSARARRAAGHSASAPRTSGSLRGTTCTRVPRSRLPPHRQKAEACPVALARSAVASGFLGGGRCPHGGGAEVGGGGESTPSPGPRHPLSSHQRPPSALCAQRLAALLVPPLSLATAFRPHPNPRAQREPFVRSRTRRRRRPPRPRRPVRPPPLRPAASASPIPPVSPGWPSTVTPYGPIPPSGPTPLNLWPPTPVLMARNIDAPPPLTTSQFGGAMAVTV